MGKKIINKGALVRAQQEKEEARQRIEQYNNNPKKCLNCGSNIYAPYDKPLRETLIKKFCSKSCGAIFNNKKINSAKIDKLSDEEIINIFKSSANISDFYVKLGYSPSYTPGTKFIERIKSLGIDLSMISYAKSEGQFDYGPMTKKEMFDRYKMWQTARGIIQKGARQLYLESDKPKCCVVCGYSKHIEVAHIKSVSSFDESSLISEINDLNNLIALCPNHHWEYDYGDLDISEFL